MGTKTGFRPGLVLAAALAAGLTAGVVAGPALAAVAPAGLSPARFGSELDAVIAATSAVNAQSIREDREYLGAILRQGGEYHYSVAPGQARADRIQVRLVVPEGFEVVALWHTHGAASPERRYFSPTDRALVESTGLALYLADYRGALQVLRPAEPKLAPDEARRLGLGSCRDCAIGQPVHGMAGEVVRIPTREVAVGAVAVNNGQSTTPDLHISAPSDPDSVT